MLLRFRARIARVGHLYGRDTEQIEDRYAFGGVHDHQPAITLAHTDEIGMRDSILRTVGCFQQKRLIAVHDFADRGSGHVKTCAEKRNVVNWFHAEHLSSPTPRQRCPT